MDISRQNLCKQAFSRLGWVLIASQALTLAVVWGGEELYTRWLLWSGLGAGEIAYRLQSSGGCLILGAAAGLLPCLLLKLTQRPEELPKIFFAAQQPVTVTTMVFCVLLMLGLQNIASLLTLPLEFAANCLGGSFYSAYTSATAASQSFSMLIYGVLVAPVCEELLYRGFVLQYLRPYGSTFAIVFSAVLFGLMHGNMIQLPIAALCGILFGYITLVYSLPASITLHALTNLIAEMTGWLNAVDEVAAAQVNQALFAFGLIALFLCIIKLHDPILDYAKSGYAEKHTVRLLMTSLPVVLLMIYLAVLTVLSVTPM